ncbi:MAG: HlyD family type I secretion periplasmic adaptor subunit [Magnetococcales bacterium]|nr:HlyD family type I secretion periplasmic adaptor subunit [Magnetococcales bacterium]
MRAPGSPLKSSIAPTPLGEQPSRRKIRYLAQSVALEETGNPFLAQMVVYTVTSIIFLFLVWAAVTRVDEVAMANGSVIPTGKVQVVQHNDGGVVEEILVQEGDVVRSGQVLIRLDTTSMRIELKELQLKETSLSAQSQRLYAFANHEKLEFVPPATHSENFMADQRKVYEAQVLAREEKSSSLSSLIRQKQADLALLGEQEKTLLVKLGYLQESFALKKSLTERGLSSKMRFLDAQTELNQVQGELRQIQTKKRQMKNVLEESEINLRELDAQLTKQALTEMGTVRAELAQVEEMIKRLSNKLGGMEIKAKVDGIVQSLSANSRGGVITPRAVILELVPLDRALIVEAKISGRDIGHVKVGQPVGIKFTAFDFARYGGVGGTLQQVSPTTVPDDRGEPYYKGTILLEASHVGPDPALRPIMPGMMVQASIQTGNKSILEYLLKPIYASVQQALQER